MNIISVAAMFALANLSGQVYDWPEPEPLVISCEFHEAGSYGAFPTLAPIERCQQA